MTVCAAAIVLAAGKSKRMGSCKQLLTLGRSPVIVRCLNTLAAGGIDNIVVVVSEDGNDVVDAIQNYPVRIVVNSECEGDMASSVRAGRDVLMTDISGAIVFLCDYPLVSSNTIASLVREHAQSPARIIIPCHRNRRGHPLLFPRTILNELTKDLNLRDLVRHDSDRVHCINVNDPGILTDMDTPEDYHLICRILGLPRELSTNSGYREH